MTITFQSARGLVLIGIVGALAAAAGAQERPRRRARTDGPPAPKVGEVAPPVKLARLGGESQVDIAEFRGKRPVVLVFGSYT